MLLSMTRSRFGVAALSATLALAGLWISGATPAHAANLEVTGTSDTPLGGTNDCAGTSGHTCTLRAAVQTASAASSPTVIHLPGGTTATPKVYTLTTNDCNTNDDTCYDLNVHGTQAVTINGDGSATTIIDGDQIDRVIQLKQTTLNLNGVTIRNGDATKNKVSGLDGGGIDVRDGGILNMSNSVLTGNTADSGGAISEEPPPNTAPINSSRPAVAQLYSAEVHLTDVSVEGNTAADGEYGGGINVRNQTLLDLVRVTVSGNSMAADGEGGGIDVDGTATILNSTIVNNSTGTGTDSTGGGLAVDGTATLTNVTLNHNTAAGTDAGANIEVYDGGTATFKNSIAANPVTDANCVIDSGGTLTSQGSNLEFPGSSCGFTGTADLQNTDPQLGPLQDNGGPTKTQALLAGSHAIDAVATANCPPPATDQRGITRPQNGKCDIGSFEVLAAVASPSPTASIAAATPSLPKAGLGVPGKAGPPWMVLTILLLLAAPIPVLLRRRA
ncbi:MAG: hypothetical protein QOK05_1294 [Chloroflexota bacterium]|jgi:hypothetical protein|nr:hypothetical protein [Chloroflexota bacterium]